MSECSICYDAVIDFPAPEATGSYRSSCGHLFHPKCIAKWHIRQDESTCPMCRKVAVELEDCAVSPESDSEEEDDEEEEEVHIHGGEIRLSRAGLEFILRQAGGVGMTAGVEAEIGFNEYGEATITRYEIERILREQGGTSLSDAQWTQLTSVYPPAEYNDDDDEEVVAGAVAMVAAVPQLTFAPSADEEADPTQRARALLANPEPPASIVTPEDREAWALVLDSARATIARHAAAAADAADAADAAAAAGASWVGLGGRWRWLTPYQYRQHPCPLELFAARDIPPTYGVAMSVGCDICKKDVMRTAFYHCFECQFDVCAECFMPDAEEAVHAPGPFDIEESPRFTLRRADIESLLQTHGSTATMEEFFNEEDGEEETLVITMTLESLNNRFASLGATPVTFMEATIAVSTIHRETLHITSFPDGTHDVMVRQRVIINPEDEPEL
jgi:hypothetical protein